MVVKRGSCPPVLQQPASCGVGLSQEAQHPSTSPPPPLPLRVARPTARRMPAVPAAVPAPQRSTRLPMGLPTPCPHLCLALNVRKMVLVLSWAELILRIYVAQHWEVTEEVLWQLCSILPRTWSGILSGIWSDRRLTDHKKRYWS